MQNLIIGLVFIVLMIPSVIYAKDVPVNVPKIENVPIGKQKAGATNSVTQKSNAIELLSYSIAPAKQSVDEPIKAQLSAKYKGKATKTVYLGISIQDMDGKWYDGEVHKYTMPPNKKVEMTTKLEMIHDDSVKSGRYTVVIALWDGHPAQMPNAQKLLQIEKKAYIDIFKSLEHFHRFDKNKWEIRENGILGRGKLLSTNVVQNGDQVMLRLDDKSLNGGELRTKEFFRYGSFQTYLKVANAPGSLTGFFLYRAPDLFHEIDIEINNDQTRMIYFTIYQDGYRIRSAEKKLPFDPTAGYHLYRFDVFEKYTAFYVDDILYQRWDGNFATNDMQLMVNSWYPDWLTPIIAKQPHTYIDWIQY